MIAKLTGSDDGPIKLNLQKWKKKVRNMRKELQSTKTLKMLVGVWHKTHVINAISGKSLRKIFCFKCSHSCLKITKKSPSTLRAKRATFPYFVVKSSIKMPNMVNFGEF